MLEDAFIDFGYTKEEYQNMRNYCSIDRYTDLKLLEKFNSINYYLLSNGYTRKDIIKMVKILPTLYSYSLENIKQKVNDMVSLGYSFDDVVKMTKSLPNIYGLSIETIKQKIDDMISLGYSFDDVVKMTKTLPTLYSYSIDSIKEKMDKMISLGYSRSDVVKMTKTLPSLYSYSTDNIRKKIDDMISLGYSFDDVLNMTKSLPALYSYSIENIKEKIEFYNSIGLCELVTRKPMFLIQSTALSYARYQFFISKGIKIDNDDYKNLFIKNKTFEERYGLSKEELLNIYGYNNESENKNGRII